MARNSRVPGGPRLKSGHGRGQPFGLPARSASQGVSNLVLVAEALPTRLDRGDFWGWGLGPRRKEDPSTRGMWGPLRAFQPHAEIPSSYPPSMGSRLLEPTPTLLTCDSLALA